jgi:hypothetical protein
VFRRSGVRAFGRSGVQAFGRVVGGRSPCVGLNA